MEQHERLQQARQDAGFTGPKEAADRFGWNEHTYKSHENGNRGLKLAVARKYALAFRVDVNWLLTGSKNETPETVESKAIPVYSDAAGGYWLEDDYLQSQEGPTISIASLSTFDAEAQYARKVRGNSVSNHIKDGEYAVLLRYEYFPGEIPNGMLVCAKRTRPGGLVEYTIKVYRNGRLFTDSAEQDTQEELALGEGEDGTLVEIDGIVIAAHRSYYPWK